jgi:hypothetical protein
MERCRLHGREDLAAIDADLRSGMSIRKTGEKYGVSHHQTYSHKHCLGLVRPTPRRVTYRKVEGEAEPTPQRAEAMELRRRRRVTSAEMSRISSFALRTAEIALVDELAGQRRADVVIKLVHVIATAAGAHTKVMELSELGDRVAEIKELLWLKLNIEV